MPPPNAIFTEIVTTTHRNHKKNTADNVTNHNALCARLMQKGRKRTLQGGRSIVCELDYAENSTYQRYSGYDALNVSASETISAAEYPWKQAAVHVTASGLELRQNSGKEALLNLVETRLKNAYRSFKNNYSQDIYSDGTAQNQINGIQSICPDATGGTLGGIDGSSHAFWNAVIQDASSPISGGAITLSAATMEGFMLQLWLELTRGADKPDLITMSNDYFELYESSQVSIKRYTSDASASTDSASGGFVTLKYKTADVVFDGGSGIPSSHLYMLNTDFMGLVCHEDADMTEVEEQRAVNQDAVVIPIITMGNLECSNRSLQGVAHA